MDGLLAPWKAARRWSGGGEDPHVLDFAPDLDGGRLPRDPGLELGGSATPLGRPAARVADPVVVLVILGAMSREVFPNAPLALVAFEARYPEQDSVTEPSVLKRLKLALADHLPLRGDVHEQEIALQVGSGRQPHIRARTVPRFVTRDRSTACQVQPESLIVETTKYSGFVAFSSLVRSVVEAVGSVAVPDGVTRIGLRYINEIRVPGVVEPPGNWREYIDSHLLAPVEGSFVAAAGLVPYTWQGVVQYGTGQHQAVTLRYGPSTGYAVPPNGPTRRKDPPEGGLFFLLDIDAFWVPDEVPAFDPALILEICDRLHAPVKALFSAVVTERLQNEVFRQASNTGGGR